MATDENVNITLDKRESAQKLYEHFRRLNVLLLNRGISIGELRTVCFESEKPFNTNYFYFVKCAHTLLAILLLASIITVSIFLQIPLPGLDFILENTLGARCVISNNYLVWESTRPLTDCNMCQAVTDALVLHNLTREGFREHAYSPRPMIAKGAALHWSAMNTFTFDYFKDMYNNIEGSYESVEEECQILTFKTEFKSLEEVFSMPESRVRLDDGEKPWYVGWSNCHPEVLEKIRSQYITPDFLPEDAEQARMDYVFVGYEQGAVMHIDYISRLMWQAQLRGHKTWTLVPTPECQDVCSRLSFRVEPGDIVLLDTRQWYHDTHIDPGEMSLTISSEYS